MQVWIDEDEVENMQVWIDEPMLPQYCTRVLYHCKWCPDE